MAKTQAHRVGSQSPDLCPTRRGPRGLGTSSKSSLLLFLGSRFTPSHGRGSLCPSLNHFFASHGVTPSSVLCLGGSPCGTLGGHRAYTRPRAQPSRRPAPGPPRSQDKGSPFALPARSGSYTDASLLSRLPEASIRGAGVEGTWAPPSLRLRA